MTIVHYYPEILKWCLAHKWQFLSYPDSSRIIWDNDLAWIR